MMRSSNLMKKITQELWLILSNQIIERVFLARVYLHYAVIALQKRKDKCPPWTIQATKMKHDNLKKTIYYDNALIKVYNIPIFYLPKLSHPDPSVNTKIWISSTNID